MRQGLPDCFGAFFGTCDAAIADWIGRRLGKHDDPYFVHWVTLNSHLPVGFALQRGQAKEIGLIGRTSGIGSVSFAMSKVYADPSLDPWKFKLLHYQQPLSVDNQKGDGIPFEHCITF
jgi:hypothetical protein